MRLGLSAAAAALLSACASLPVPQVMGGDPPPSGGKVGKPYQIAGIWYVPKEDTGYDKVGVASWYGQQFHLKKTANGETFDMNVISAAHTTLPLPCLVEVTNLDNGRKLVVRINDRGPFVGGRIIDLSRAAARELGYERQGTARVRVRYVGPADGRKPPQQHYAQVEPRRGSDGGPFRIQVAAFADPQNAEKAVRRLQAAGDVRVEPASRDGVVFYRVLVSGEGDLEQARRKIAQAGYPEARVLRGDD